jgi:hypothetical protein
MNNTRQFLMVKKQEKSPSDIPQLLSKSDLSLSLKKLDFLDSSNSKKTVQFIFPRGFGHEQLDFCDYLGRSIKLGQILKK